MKLLLIFVFLFPLFTLTSPAHWEGKWKVFPESKSGEVPTPPSDALETDRVSSVMGIQTRLGVMKDAQGKVLNPYLGSDLLRWPGAPTSLRGRFDKENMPAGSPYAKPWWYVKNFSVKKLAPQDRLWLDLRAINYSAELYINGKKIPADLMGPYRNHHIDITDSVSSGSNTLSIRVEPAGVDNVGYTWLDWNPHPSDKMLGVLDEPVFTIGSAVRIHSPSVRSIVQSNGKSADLVVDFYLLNSSKTPVEGKYTVTYRGASHSEKITLPASTSVAEPSRSSERLDKADLRTLHVASPRLWWPRGMGEAHLEKLQIRFEGKGIKPVTLSANFGIRQIHGWLEGPVRKFTINHRPLVIRGVGWAPDFLMDETLEKKKQKVKYVIDMGYNAIRHEGTMEASELYDLTDKEGILVMGGWPCCTQWEADETGKAWDLHKEWLWTDKKYQVAANSLRDQLEMLRTHSSFLGWFNGSDLPPHQKLEKMYKEIYSELLGDKYLTQILPRAADDNESRHSPEFGRSGVRMDGPYDHVMAGYWYDPKLKGFHSELGPGISIAGRDSLFDLAPDAKWPLFSNCKDAETLNKDLLEHTGTPVFEGMKFFYQDLCLRYGEPKDLDDFLRKTQLMNYEDARAMNEGFRRKGLKGITTAHVHWMGMNAWPSARWNLFDYFLRQGGSYYGAKKAQESLHLQFSYDDQSVWLINETTKKFPKLKFVVTAYSASSQKLFQHMLQEVKINAARNVPQGEAIAVLGKEIEKGFTQVPKEEDAMILSMRLFQGKTLLDSQTYWVSRTTDEFDPNKKAKWFRTATTKSATFASLAKAQGNDALIKVSSAGKNSLRVTVKNPSKDRLSFFNRLTVKEKKSKKELWPQYWSDNFVTLEPGESQDLSVKLPDQVHSKDVEVSAVF